MGTCEVWAWQQWGSGERGCEGNGKRITAEKQRTQRKATATAKSRRDAGATKTTAWRKCKWKGDGGEGGANAL